MYCRASAFGWKPSGKRRRCSSPMATRWPRAASKEPPGTIAVWDDPFPKPAYLFALVAGKLARVEDSFITRSGRKIDLHIYVEPGKEDRCPWAMQSIKAAMAWDEKTFGREYDLDLFMVVAVSSFNMGAMENKGLNIFNDKYVLARPDSATDLDYTNIEAVIAHEYFHNWTGNRITCRDWFQLCLKEGLTVFRDQEFSSDVRSRAVQRIEDVRTLRARQFPEDQGPLAHPVRPRSYIEINNFYTATVYEKGAELVRMMKTLLGAGAFRKGMDLYFARHDGEAVTMEDFVRCMEETSGRSLKQFFRWYEQAGTPELRASGKWNAKTKTFALTLSQRLRATPGQRHKKPLHIPVAVGLLGANGHDMEIETHRKRQAGRGSRTDREDKNVSLPKYRFEAHPFAQSRLFRSAPRRLATVGRRNSCSWSAMTPMPSIAGKPPRQSAVRLILGSMAARPKSAPPEGKLRAFADALRHTLAERELDPHFLSLLLTLPSEQDITNEIARNVDPQRIHEAREEARHKLGLALEAELMALWESRPPEGHYNPDPASVGRRSLRHAALALLAAADARNGAGLAFSHFAGARNMTDAIGALTVLIELDEPQREEALRRFPSPAPRRPSAGRQVVRTASPDTRLSPLSGGSETLLDHPQFSWKVPNRLRALVGTFAASNPVAFHAPDGSGYQLLAEVVGKLDGSNPQVAARLAASFKGCNALEAKRRRRAATGAQNDSRDQGPFAGQLRNRLPLPATIALEKRQKRRYNPIGQIVPVAKSIDS